MANPNKIAWIASIAAAVVLGLMGVMKLMNPDMARAEFANWGYPPWFGLVVGAAEVGTALLLVLPRTAFLGGLGALVIMIGAIVTHLSVPEVGLIPLAVVVAAAGAVVAFVRRPGAFRAGPPRAGAAG